MALKFRVPDNFIPIPLRLDAGRHHNLCYWVWPRGKKYYESSGTEARKFLNSLVGVTVGPLVSLDNLSVMSMLLEEALEEQKIIWNNLLGGSKACRIYKKEAK